MGPWKASCVAATTLCLRIMTPPSRHSTIAIVGGGITGSCAAAELSKHFEHVLVFDQGRRGPGGRASHRSVRAADGAVLLPDYNDDSTETFEFDHGCQFFRADSVEMQTELLPRWTSQGWAAPWKGRFGCLRKDDDDTSKEVDFFGIPSRTENVYIGVDGMHQLPRKILESSGASLHSGTRVSSVRKNDQGRWNLYGLTGDAAYHDTKESEAGKATEQIIGTADAVVFTDISSSSDSWHRASAGIPDSLRQQIPKKARLPLFSCMVALRHPIGDNLALDGFTVADSPDLWFAARSHSKPGFGIEQSNNAAECWTLISTPAFAVDQISATEMRDPITGAFRPQENSYLNSVPGPALFAAFQNAIKPHLKDSDALSPEAVYLQAQRWGSGLPAPDSIADDIHEICGTRYARTLTSSLVYPRPQEEAADYVLDDSLGLYYAGDFCSHRNPGFEAAALSGLDVAKHIVASTLP
jgi:predicted NAD/FAD-dependent oxidoreductase